MEAAASACACPTVSCLQMRHAIIYGMSEEISEAASAVERGNQVKASVPDRGPWIIVGAVIVILALTIGLVVAVSAAIAHPSQTQTIRDVVIIFMAAEFLILGLALIILMVQVARLTALIQNEIRPMLDATNETLGTLRGTTAFLSDHLVQPVIKANSSASAVRRAIDLLRFGRSG
jgi:hypothetical protein